MNVDHKIYVETVNGREFWECSCGMGGSAPEGHGEIASDKHIKPGESRFDTSRPLDGL